MKQLRVIQWTTGKVGKLSLRGVLDDPRLELVGVYAYSDEKAMKRHVPGMLDDYAYAAIACLDAYEATADLSYFTFAHRIAESVSEDCATVFSDDVSH